MYVIVLMLFNSLNCFCWSKNIINIKSCHCISQLDLNLTGTYDFYCLPCFEFIIVFGL